MTLSERLNKIIPKFEDPAFLANQGIGNDIGFYIFDYPPEEEVSVRDAINVVKAHFEKSGAISVVEINLFDLLINILKQRKLLDKVVDLEKSLSSTELKKKLQPIVKKEVVVDAIMKLVDPEHDVLLLTGVGSAFPLIRTHELLNNLHDKLDNLPLVVFFPGEYNMQELRLFGLLESNYYRAFRLVD